MITTRNGKAYGKINIGLDVLRKRIDGYHEVKMIMQTISLHDKISLTATSNHCDIIIDTNLNYLPKNENNIIYQAIKLVKDEFKIQKGFQVKLEKHIPVAAGMAGGSADAALTLELLNEMFSLGLTRENLMKRAINLGADVPYCILKGTAVSEGIGEILTPISPLFPCYILIVKPPVYVSTKFVYEHLDMAKKLKHPDIDGIIKAIQHRNIEHMSQCMGNILESVTEETYPVIKSIKQLMIAQGAFVSLMTGSGPTVFGLFTNKAIIKQAASYFKTQYPTYRTYITTPIEQA